MPRFYQSALIAIICATLLTGCERLTDAWNQLLGKKLYLACSGEVKNRVVNYQSGFDDTKTQKAELTMTFSLGSKAVEIRGDPARILFAAPLMVCSQSIETIVFDSLRCMDRAQLVNNFVKQGMPSTEANKQAEYDLDHNVSGQYNAINNSISLLALDKTTTGATESSGKMICQIVNM